MGVCESPDWHTTSPKVDLGLCVASFCPGWRQKVGSFEFDFAYEYTMVISLNLFE
jgi:hypothetical protein